MPEEKRVRRTPQQIAQDLDAQMEKLNASIAELEEKKAASAAVFDGKIAAVKEKSKKLEARKKDVLAPKKRKVRKTKGRETAARLRRAFPGGSASAGKTRQSRPPQQIPKMHFLIFKIGIIHCACLYL